MRGFVRSSAVAALLLGLLAGCSSGGDDGSGGNAGGNNGPTGPSGTPVQSATVNMEASSFAPGEVLLRRGGTVRWVNARAVPHTVSPDSPGQAGAWRAADIPATQGAEFAHTFATAGNFTYHCALHAGMTGTIRVQ